MLIAIVLQGALAAKSYFTGDDWLHIVLAHDLVSGGGLPDVNYLGHVVFIHYAPGLRLGYWALERFAPLDWAAGLAALLVLFAGSMLLLYRIFKQLFGDRRSNLVLLLLFGTSILLVTSFLWFADGLHKLPSTFLSLLAIDAYLTYWKTRSKAALALSVAAVSLGSLFYVKVLLVPLYLVLIRLLFLEERPRRALRVLWAERLTWLAFLPTVAIYLWNYLANYSHTRGPAPSLHLLGDYLWLNWFKGVTPALAGVEIGPHAAQSGVLFAAMAQLFADRRRGPQHPPQAERLASLGVLGRRLQRERRAGGAGTVGDDGTRPGRLGAPVRHGDVVAAAARARLRVLPGTRGAARPAARAIRLGRASRRARGGGGAGRVPRGGERHRAPASRPVAGATTAVHRRRM